MFSIDLLHGPIKIWLGVDFPRTAWVMQSDIDFYKS